MKLDLPTYLKIWRHIWMLPYSVMEHPKKLLKHCWKIVKKNVNLQKVQVARVWCVTSLKVPARTHIAHIFEKSFRTHTHTCDRTSHTCVRACTFATHTLAVIVWSNFIFTNSESCFCLRLPTICNLSQNGNVWAGQWSIFRGFNI